MKELTIEKSNAIKAHKAADTKGKKLLEDLLGADTFKPENIIDRVRSYEDACEVLGLDADEELPYPTDTTRPAQISMNAYCKLMIIIEALNEGWIPDYRNSDQYKYYPWLKANPSGLGLSYYDFDYDGSNSYVGSRLVLKTSDLAIYVGQQFINIYNEYNNNLSN